MKNKFQLIAIDTELPVDEQEQKVIFEGTESECFGKFHSVCSFSFSNHKKYSYTHYSIEEIKRQEL
jgi:hypothetical protein